MKKHFFILAIISTNSFGQAAQTTQNCTSIVDSSARLACFDSVGKKTPKITKGTVSPEQQLLEKKRAEDEKFRAEEESRIRLEQAARQKADEENRASAEKIQIAAQLEKQKLQQLAKDVLRSLRKFENRIETGISYKDYPSAFSDARFEVKSFVDSSEGKKLQNFSQYCHDAITNYTDAQAVWRQKIVDSSRYTESSIYSDFALVDYITTKYPETAIGRNGRAIKANNALQIIFSQATLNISKAEQELLK
jgi:hypothetical protein